MFGEAPIPSDAYERTRRAALRDFTEEITLKLPFSVKRVVTIHYMLMDCDDGPHWIAWHSCRSNPALVLFSDKGSEPNGRWKTLKEARNLLHTFFQHRKMQ